MREGGMEAAYVARGDLKKPVNFLGYCLQCFSCTFS